ncbi:DNA polymerase III subunit gamma and tau, partial [Streptomyces sp. NPDC055929]
EPGRRPGGWPTAASPGQGAPQPAAAPATPRQQAPQAPQPPAPSAAAPAGGGAGQVRTMWPDILEAVKNRRRFTWILLSQNAQVAGFDGTTLQVGFVNAGARDNFAGSGSEDVLRQALAERFNVHWKIEAIVDPSGGAGHPSGPGQPPSGGYGGGYGGPGGGAAPPQRPPAPAAPQAPRPPEAPAAPASQQPAPQQAAPKEPPRSAEPPAPPPVSLEDDVPEEDDPDLVDSALSGHDLIVRELGATVVEEYTNE